MHIFDKDVSLTGKAPFQYAGKVSDNWSINGNPDGGYVMAVMANAMLQHSHMQSTPIITANYIARCLPGDIDLHVEAIAESKQFQRIGVRLIQNGRETTRAMGTFVDVKDECAVERYETASPEMAPRDACIQIPEIPAFTLYDHLDVRLDPACAAWMQGSLTDRSEHRGWISFKDERPYDLLAILLVVDSFPPAVFSTQGMAAWVPTIELSVNVRNIPETKWLKCIFRTRHITCGLLEEDGEVWDEAGNLVAISRQIAQFRKA